MAEETKAAEPTVEELKVQLAAAHKENAASKSIINEQNEKLSAVQKENESAKSIIAQQNEQIAELDAQKGSKYPVVTVSKKKYHIVTPSFRMDNKVVTAEDVKKDSALAAKLVKMGAGVLVEVEPSKAD